MCLQVVLFFFSLLYYKGIYLLIVKRGKFHLKKKPQRQITKTAATLKTCFVGHFIQIPSFGALCFISLRAGPGGLELSRMACRRGWGSRLFGSFYSFGSPLLQVWLFFYCIREPSQNSLGTHSSGTREAGDRASPPLCACVPQLSAG